MRAVSGEEEDKPSRDDKNAAAKELDAKGGRKRAENMAPDPPLRDRTEGGGKSLAQVMQA